tara:strand:+ start:333 stop:701 length:369 start_codon:yes stop_codon:yes gene_type:complete
MRQQFKSEKKFLFYGDQLYQNKLTRKLFTTTRALNSNVDEETGERKDSKPPYFTSHMTVRAIDGVPHKFINISDSMNSFIYVKWNGKWWKAKGYLNCVDELFTTKKKFEEESHLKLGLLTKH